MLHQSADFADLTPYSNCTALRARLARMQSRYLVEGPANSGFGVRDSGFGVLVTRHSTPSTEDPDPDP